MLIKTSNLTSLILFGVTIFTFGNASAQIGGMQGVPGVPSGLIINSLPGPPSPNQKPDATPNDVVIGNPAAALQGVSEKFDFIRISGFESNIPKDVEGYNLIKPYLYEQMSREKWNEISREIFASYVARGKLVRANLNLQPDGRAVVDISELKLRTVDVRHPGFTTEEAGMFKQQFEDAFKIGEPLNLRDLKSMLSVVDYRGQAMATTKFLEIDANGIALNVRLEPKLPEEESDNWVASIDNYGLPGFGRARLGLSYSAPLLSQSDNIGLQAVASTGLQNISGRYDFPMPGILPFRATVWASLVRYSATVDDIKQRGNATMAGADLNYPRFYWGGGQLVFGGGYEFKRSRDTIVGILNTTRTINNLHARVKGSGFWSNRIAFNLDATVGDLNIDGPLAELQDSLTTQSRGGFQKINGQFDFATPFAPRTEFQFSTKGQLATKNLDSMEKIYFGGNNAVRAYDNSISADQGLTMTAGVMYTPAPVNELLMKFGPFVDYGIGRISRFPWEEEFAEDQSNIFHISDIGFQVNAMYRKIALNANLSYPINRGGIDKDQGLRVWASASTFF